MKISWPSGYALVRFEELDSTNSEACRRAQAGEEGPLWISAARQTQGRGRRGRAWDAGQGNLAATLLLRPKAPQSLTAQLSFAAALATAEMVSHFAPNAAIRVKWPNDVLAEGKKVAGILLEGGAGWLAIGIGVNLASFPPTTEFPATSLAQLGLAPPSPEEALTVLAARFAHWYDVWMKDGFTDLGVAWGERAQGISSAITVRLPKETVQGQFVGIRSDGALLLWDGKHTRAITAGEVFF